MANRKDYYYLQLLAESELDAGFDGAEQAIWDVVADHGLSGIVTGGALVQHSPTADLTVDLPLLIAYDSDGARIRVPSLQRIDVSEDHLGASTDVAVAGNEKIVSVFVFFDRVLGEPRIDGNGITVYFDRDEGFGVYVKQGAESTAPATPPSLEAGMILIADIRRTKPQTQILNSDITPPGGSYAGIANRRQDAFVLQSGSLIVRAGTAEASDQAILDHVETLTTAPGIQVAASSTWHDGTTNPADDLQARIDKIISDLAGETTGILGAGGGAMVGHFTLPSWSGGSRARPAQSIVATLIEIQQHLEAQGPAGDDGAIRIGSEARTGTHVNLTQGTVASQLQEVIDELGGLSTNNTWTGTNEFESTVLSDGGIEVRNGSTLYVSSGATALVQNGGQLNVQSGGLLDVQAGSIATVSTILALTGAESGVAHRTGTLGDADANLDVGTDEYRVTINPTAPRTFTLLDTTGNTPINGQRIRVIRTFTGVATPVSTFQRETGSVAIAEFPVGVPSFVEFTYHSAANGWYVSAFGGGTNVFSHT